MTQKGKSLAKKQEYKPKTMLQIIFSQFMDHKFAVIGLGIILLFSLLSIFAPAISSITGIYPSDQNIFNRYKKPLTTLPFTNDKAETVIKKFSQKDPAIVELIKAQVKNTPGIDTSLIDFSAEKYEFLTGLYDVMKRDENINSTLQAVTQEPLRKFIDFTHGFSTTHYLGTDELGRDVLMRLIYGARVSIGVGVLVALSGALIGLLVGCLAGFYGGVIDNILMRVTDSLMSIPLMPILIILCAVDLKKVGLVGGMMTTSTESIMKIVFVLTIFSWMTAARLVRGCILSLKELDFIHAAKVLGAKNSYIITRHLIPNVMAPLLVEVTLRVGNAILMEAALSFLGLGIQPPTPSWGNMLLNAIEIVYNAPTLAIFPGLLILITVVSFNFFGDGLQDAVNPHSIRR